MLKRFPTLIDNCTGCTACYNICKHNAINMIENDEGFFYPKIDITKCIDCGICENVCPELSNTNRHSNELKKAFYGWHRDDNIRLKSSSGGIFSCLAEKVLNEKGVVFGAYYDISNGIVRHTSSNELDFQNFRKSKYVQSSLGVTFNEVKTELSKNKKVLFTGTPCQVSGLQNFLQNNEDNLITCDFICHGVPPMKLLNDHITFIDKKNRKTTEVDFRPKTRGWSNYELKVVYKNKKKVSLPSSYDAYFNAFFKNLSLRKCCYYCKYSEEQHKSDITLADFWGYRRYNPDLNDEKGLSLIIANTFKGDQLIKQCEDIECNLLEWEFASYVFKKRTHKTFDIDKRNNFFQIYITKGWKKTVLKYKLKGSLNSIIKHKAKNLLKYLTKP